MVLSGAVLLAAISVSVRVRIVQVIVVGVLAAVPVAVPVSAVGVLMMRFAVGLLGFRRPARPQAEPSQRQQPEVEGRGVGVPPVGKAPDQRQGVHRPIEAEPVRAKQEPEVDGGQVGKRERPGEEGGGVGRRVVGVGEVGGFVAHPVEAAGQQHGSPGCQQKHVQQQADVLSLEGKENTGPVIKPSTHSFLGGCDIYYF